MIFKLDSSGGQPIYLQLVRQVQHAIETGVLQDGDLMPGIRTLAEQLAVSHNTVAKAYNELEREGRLDLRHGSGAYICAGRGVKSRAARLLRAQEQVEELVDALRDDGYSADEIRRMFEARLLHSPAGKK